MTGKRVVSVDPEKKSAKLDDGTSLAFDKALLCTGGSPRRLSIPGRTGRHPFSPHGR